MIDFHSHILPCMDDGSRTLDESVEMLRLSFAAGIDTIVATPHYRPEFESIENFLERRDNAVKKLFPRLLDCGDIPNVVMGAEASFFSGMSGEKDLGKLCIRNTKYLLLEMPYTGWNTLDVSEIRRMILSRGIIPVLAHAERYVPFGNRRKTAEMLGMGAVYQANGKGVTAPETRKYTLRLIKSGAAAVLGSDCHDTALRPPGLDLAFGIIKRELGEESIEEIDMIGRRILRNEPV